MIDYYSEGMDGNATGSLEDFPQSELECTIHHFNEGPHPFHIALGCGSVRFLATCNQNVRARIKTAEYSQCGWLVFGIFTEGNHAGRSFLALRAEPGHDWHYRLVRASESGNFNSIF